MYHKAQEKSLSLEVVLLDINNVRQRFDVFHCDKKNVRRRFACPCRMGVSIVVVSTFRMSQPWKSWRRNTWNKIL